MSSPALRALTTVTNVSLTDTGIIAELGGGVRPELLRVDAIRDDVVRLKISRGGVFDESPSYAVRDDLEQEEVDVDVEIGAERVTVSTPAVTVSVTTEPFGIDVHRADGTVVVETAPDGDGGRAGYATLNDAFAFARRSSPGGAVYGLGEKTGPHNRKGKDYNLWNVDVLNPTSSGEFTRGRDAADPRADPMSTDFDPYYMSIPFVIEQDPATGHAFGSFVDNGYSGHYDFRNGDRTAVRFEGGQYTEYIFAGPDIPGIIEAYTWLTGRTALPPLWSLGYHQCRWHGYEQSDVLELAQGFREREIPCDTLWLDIEYMDGYRVFTWNSELFPDVPGMLSSLEDDGFRMITIVDPGVKAEPGYGVFDDAVERGVLCLTEGGDIYIGQVWPGDTAFPDLVTEEGRRWWGALNAEHVRSGIAGIWNDMNEPATGVISPLGMRFGRGEFSHERYHNQYALLMAMGTTQGLLEAMPDRRTFVLSRAGSAGIQRYAANWMGDNVANWDHLRLSIAMANGLGMSGQAFVGADIGGFAGDSGAELFARWMQYGALTPFCRNHSMIYQRPQYPWSFGPAVERIAREALQLRYRLLPYIYSAFVAASETGAPVQRPLAFSYQYDAIVESVEDQYLFGADLLVAPIVEAGAVTRSVYLPEGGWYDWHTDEYLSGGRHIAALAPLDRIPLYARAGAVVPMLGEAPASTRGLAPREVELHLFVPEAGAPDVVSTLHEDDGESFAASDGAVVRTRVTVSRDGDTVRVSAVSDGDGFDGFARERFILVVHGADPSGVDMSATWDSSSAASF
ncbi:glycoside hydrolase family 31 protein, partial [Mycetocola reblochoni]|uniref:glycoside hydrolase family 31 protein n=1 Tax=Mycetocola reblochoni TaxID=331618 RepID=UPI003F9607BB